MREATVGHQKNGSSKSANEGNCVVTNRSCSGPDVNDDGAKQERKINISFFRVIRISNLKKQLIAM